MDLPVLFRRWDLSWIEAFRVCHVLIIEDEALVAMDIEEILERAGATSFAFSASEDEAVAAAFAHPPSVITSDVRLFSGTGPSAIRRIHEELGDIPVIFITGSPDECTPCDPPGVVLAKPLDARAIGLAFHACAPGEPH